MPSPRKVFKIRPSKGESESIFSSFSVENNGSSVFVVFFFLFFFVFFFTVKTSQTKEYTQI